MRGPTADMLQKAEDAVRAYIVGAITRGDFRPENRLPPERALAEEIGVSRAAVRQALTVLEAENRIHRHVGRGTFVSAPGIEPSHQARRPVIDTSPSKLLEARNVLEVRLAELVVLNATEKDLRAIRDAAEAMEGISDARDFERADAAFHRAIAYACHNDLLIGAYDLIEAAREDPEWIKLKISKNQHAEKRKDDVRREHARLVEAFEARDRDEAAGAMQSHLQAVRINLLGF
ncbi:FadR/GntR family transcriptional regulator [Pelagibacterium sediminicola]|uniref:FadR/GntR family transcriptional regulator n=1 Tax=Pelagibacterium sediminicola TaxID=2248761 RepID=UPI000E316581|nr:FCD domain-containing protein [Pelagibacterium sediminicola]